MKNGKVKLTYNNGDEYEGEWKNDKKKMVKIMKFQMKLKY